MATRIPAAHADLLEGPRSATLSTLAGDGSIQSSLVWFDFHDGAIRVNTTDDTAKARNLARNPRATLLIPSDAAGARYLTLTLELDRMEREGAVEHLDHVTRMNSEEERWYGGMMPVDEAEMARRVILVFRVLRAFGFA